MFKSIFEDFINGYRNGNRVNQLLIINILVFVTIVFTRLGFKIADPNDDTIFTAVLHKLFFTNNLNQLILQPWSIITSIFTHYELGHIFFNMLLLLMMGNIAGDLLGNNRILTLYVYGGIVGLLFFTLGGLLFQYKTSSYATGASAAVMAIALAAATTSPNYNVRLLLLGNVKLKYVVGFLLLLDLITISELRENTGGSIAHLGGAFFGFIFVNRLYAGYDLSIGFNRVFNMISGFFTKKKDNVRTMKATVPAYKVDKKTNNKEEVSNFEEKLNFILEKINKSGINSLSKQEKDFLEKASKK